MKEGVNKTVSQSQIANGCWLQVKTDEHSFDLERSVFQLEECKPSIRCLLYLFAKSLFTVLLTVSVCLLVLLSMQHTVFGAFSL